MLVLDVAEPCWKPRKKQGHSTKQFERQCCKFSQREVEKRVSWNPLYPRYTMIIFDVVSRRQLLGTSTSDKDSRRLCHYPNCLLIPSRPLEMSTFLRSWCSVAAEALRGQKLEVEHEYHDMPTKYQFRPPSMQSFRGFHGP